MAKKIVRNAKVSEKLKDAAKLAREIKGDKPVRSITKKGSSPSKSTSSNGTWTGSPSKKVTGRRNIQDAEILDMAQLQNTPYPMTVVGQNGVWTGSPSQRGTGRRDIQDAEILDMAQLQNTPYQMTIAGQNGVWTGSPAPKGKGRRDIQDAEIINEAPNRAFQYPRYTYGTPNPTLSQSGYAYGTPINRGVVPVESASDAVIRKWRSSDDKYAHTLPDPTVRLLNDDPVESVSDAVINKWRSSDASRVTPTGVTPTGVVPTGGTLNPAEGVSSVNDKKKRRWPVILPWLAAGAGAGLGYLAGQYNPHGGGMPIMPIGEDEEQVPGMPISPYDPMVPAQIPTHPPMPGAQIPMPGVVIPPVPTPAPGEMMPHPKPKIKKKVVEEVRRAAVPSQIQAPAMQGVSAHPSINSQAQIAQINQLAAMQQQMAAADYQERYNRAMDQAGVWGVGDNKHAAFVNSSYKKGGLLKRRTK